MLWLWALLLSRGLVACTSSSDRPQTTRMTAGDFVEMAGQMAQSLIHSDAVGERRPDSPRWVVSIDKVQNLSSDVMTEPEQWAIMARLRGAMPIQSLWDLKNVRFVIPPQRVVALRHHPDAVEFGASFGSRRQPTHMMTATFRSITRAQATRRIDLYYCEFEILDLDTGQTVWTDRFEYKRAARGHIWD